MRRRSDRQGKPADDNPRAMQEEQDARETSHDEQAPQRSCVKTVLLLAVVLGVVYVCVPFVVRFFPRIMYHAVFSHVVRVPFFADLSRPEELGLNHTVNLYLSPEEGITLGIWHTVPDSLWQEAQGKDLEWYQQTLENGAPIFIYLHGNAGTRATNTRIGLVKVLSAAGFHVLSLDYRGFGDSSGEPTEAGLTTDALYLYQWVKAHSGSSLVIIWGHSLGTGVATNTAVQLQEQGVTVDGVIVEGAFTNIWQAGASHPFAWIYRKFPYFEYFFLDTISDNEVVFPNDENMRKLRSPILILHSEDDHIIPFHMGKKLYEIAQQSRNSEDSVRMVPFDGSHGYKHNGLYKEPQLPVIIKQFVQSLHM